MLSKKSSGEGILKLLKRLEIHDGKGAKRDEGAWGEKYNWRNNSKQEKKELFSQKVEVRWYETKQRKDILLSFKTGLKSSSLMVQFLLSSARKAPVLRDMEKRSERVPKENKEALEQQL